MAFSPFFQPITYQKTKLQFKAKRKNPFHPRLKIRVIRVLFLLGRE